jgi:hypothetical protein
MHIFKALSMSAIPRTRLECKYSGMDEIIGGGASFPARQLDVCIPILKKWMKEDLTKEVAG